MFGVSECCGAMAIFHWCGSVHRFC